LKKLTKIRTPQQKSLNVQEENVIATMDAELEDSNNSIAIKNGSVLERYLEKSEYRFANFSEDVKKAVRPHLASDHLPVLLISD